MDPDEHPRARMHNAIGAHSIHSHAIRIKRLASTFERIVYELLNGLHKFVSMYTDDIIIFSTTWNKHNYSVS